MINSAQRPALEDALGPRHRVLLTSYRRIRTNTVALTGDLSAEDCLVQSMPDASPIKWHLAHLTWFFETFVLEPALGGRFVPFDAAFRTLFNSYYVGVGTRHPRAERGLISRPSLETVVAYRRAIDEQVERLLTDDTLPPELCDLIELGLHHEQQHQELMLTDLKHHLWKNPTMPIFRRVPSETNVATTVPLRFMKRPEGIAQIGVSTAGFAFDNERPRHRVWLAPFALASRLVSCGEYLAFIADGGYTRPELWLSDGWDICVCEAWQAPLYWRCDEGAWTNFTLHGHSAPALNEPVSHVSYYEAEAYARWANARLPTEAEWECVAEAALPDALADGNFVDDQLFQPRAANPAHADRVQQLFGDVWEWTQSAYLPYPGFRTAAGAVGEYNGKFMINQMVLRGGSCATPRDHMRCSYRNFFPPEARWQFSGIRLAKDLADGA